jgi:hypothetical protein
MPQIIEVPGHGQVEFPDGMSDADIASAIQKNMAPSAPKQTMGEKIMGAAKTVGGTALKGMFSGAGPMAGAMNSLTDLSGDVSRQVAYDAGGRVTDLATQAGASPETAAKFGFAANVGTQAVPTLLAGEVAKKAFGPSMREGGRALMQSAVKPTLEQLRTGKAARAINTMLEEGYSPTKGGVDAMKARIADLNDEIADAIKNSPATVDKGQVASYLNDTLKKFEKQVNPTADVNAIQNAWTEFLSHPMLAGQKDIPVQLAQQMKQGTYKALGDKSFGELKGASTEAQKTLARGLKEEISKVVPEVAGKNKLESELINAAKVAERRVLMDANKNPLGLGWLAQPWMIPFWMWDRSPGAKALTARALYSGSEQIPATLARGGVGALMSQTGLPPEDPRGILYNAP